MLFDKRSAISVNAVYDFEEAMNYRRKLVKKFPGVFETNPLDPLPIKTIEKIQKSKELKSARVYFEFAYRGILSAGDHINAAVALVELAKLDVRTRSLSMAEITTEKAVHFCMRFINIDTDDENYKNVTMINRDAGLYRGIYHHMTGSKDIAQKNYQTCIEISRKLEDDKYIEMIKREYSSRL